MGTLEHKVKKKNIFLYMHMYIYIFYLWPVFFSEPVFYICLRYPPDFDDHCLV